MRSELRNLNRNLCQLVLKRKIDGLVSRLHHCAGGGSVSSETGWDGRKKNEEDQNFRLRCWLQAAKTVKASRYVPTKREGRGM